MQQIKKIVTEYRNLGLNILPASQGKKHPNISSWKEYAEIRVPDDLFNAWVNDGRFFNINLVLGETSKIAEIDVDVENVPVGLITMGYRSNEIWICQSSKGKIKIFFKPKNDNYKRHLDEIVNKDGGHVEYRGNGHLSVLPPSIHPSGSVYTWLRPIQKLDEIDGDELYNSVISKLRSFYAYQEKKREEIRQEEIELKNTGKGVRDFFFKSMRKGTSWSGSSGHYFRLAFCAELINNGYTDEQIHVFFKTHDERSGEDYSYTITQKKIDELRRKGMRCWTNKKLLECCSDILEDIE